MIVCFCGAFCSPHYPGVVLQSESTPAPYNAQWENRPGVDKDPTIYSTPENEVITADDLMYQEASGAGAVTNGGFNVWIRAFESVS